MLRSNGSQLHIYAAIVAALLLACFVAILYYPLLFTNRVLANGDILLYFYPYRDYAAAALREGRIPLWNPYIFNGVPFLANPQAAVLYPLHWPLSWLPVTKQIYWSAALHTWILSYGGFWLVRQQGATIWAGLITALVLAGSGFYGGLIGHINQMNGAAWLPWMAIVVQVASGKWGVPGGECWVASGAIRYLWRLFGHTIRHSRFAICTTLFALLVTLTLLAGHTQTAYINLFGVGLWLVWRAAIQFPNWRLTLATLRQFAENVTPPLLVYGSGVLLAILLCAVQLLPTLELSALGLRSGGLGYGEVSSFSLRPTRLPWTLLPTYGLVELGPIFGPGYTEFVAHVGLVALLLAALGAWQGRGPLRAMGLFFALLGLFLALGRWNPVYYLLYQFVPGFDLFRVPARWMMLYTLGVALLAGSGTVCVTRPQNSHLPSISHLPSPISRLPSSIPLLILVTILAVDLLLAAQALPHSQPTAPQAVYDQRTAPAHLLTDPARAALDPAAMGRFLSMSTITYDPGDMADWQRVLIDSAPSQIDQRAFQEFIIAVKTQELLVPNLPLLWRIPAVDGFDGGVLPLQRYNQFLTLFLPPDELVPDGRLREQIKTIPEADLLGLLNVQYVITDKVRDLWFENVFYDRQIGVQLTQDTPTTTIRGTTAFAATHLDLIGYVDGAHPWLHEDNQPVATVWAFDTNGDAIDLPPIIAGGKAGAQLTDQQLDSSAAAEAGATVAFRDVEQEQQEYHVRLPLPTPTEPVTITIELLPDAPPIVIQAATLYDERTKMFFPLLPSGRGDFALVHSGDVKIYENLQVRPRAYLVNQVFAAADGDDALHKLKNERQIYQGHAAVVEGIADSHDFALDPMATAEIVHYSAETVVIETSSTEPTFLVLSDSYFPGWQATIDGSPTSIYVTNVLFRGVVVPAGEQTITFHYQPESWQRGRWLSGFGVLLWAGLLFVSPLWRFRERRTK